MKNGMNRIIAKDKCSGCSACTAICPMQCISMIPDDEGFSYPEIDTEKCVNCNACVRVCPVRNSVNEVSFEQKGYVVSCNDDIIQRASAAGGAFSALAQTVIDNGGYVCGVALDEKFRAVHRITNNREDIINFSGSKYMQSDVECCFRSVLELLNKNKTVLFSGTPCQVEGLLNYVGKKNENLYTVDIVCHSVPSPGLFKSYIKYIENKYDDTICGVKFRDKRYGYSFPTIKLIGQRRGEFYYHGMESDPWLRAFFSNMCDRPSCYHCGFKKQYRRSDMTIWDCHNPEKYIRKISSDTGVTKVLVHSEKGLELFNQISDQYTCVEIDPRELVQSSDAMFHSIPMNQQRSTFWEDAKLLDGAALFEKYFPLSPKMYIKHYVRVLLVKLKIQKYIKCLYHLFRR